MCQAPFAQASIEDFNDFLVSRQRPHEMVGSERNIEARQILVGFAPPDQSRSPVIDEDNGGSRSVIVIARHGQAVGPRSGNRHDVAGLNPRQVGVANENVAGLTELPATVTVSLTASSGRLARRASYLEP